MAEACSGLESIVFADLLSNAVTDKRGPGCKSEVLVGKGALYIILTTFNSLIPMPVSSSTFYLRMYHLCSRFLMICITIKFIRWS